MSRLSEVLTGAFALKPYLKASWAIQANIAAVVKLLVFIWLVLWCVGSKGLHQKWGYVWISVMGIYFIVSFGNLGIHPKN
ncbi:hypothetical protein [Pacificibacter marinus]|uniref:Uncharacterized protein n=2 Tax=Pacificibacter marinus TaxID=658057 RepID=A0A1Y5SGW9_9RHOB|nr:hypothetical protein [Pacificibacter marinus]SEK63332.1 hypothetical protein SAMN04488032_104238 [Pacificibacter marinus]SLN40520.1 hypothetical protein PAM7971_01839 [Pacificibacter marinus]